MEREDQMAVEKALKGALEKIGKMDAAFFREHPAEVDPHVAWKRYRRREKKERNERLWIAGAAAAVIALLVFLGRVFLSRNRRNPSSD